MADKKKHRCYRCSYLADCGDLVCCGYMEQTGKPRSFPEGGGKQIRWSDTEPCPYYKPKRGRWFKDVPRGPGIVSHEPPPPQQPKIDRRKGIRTSWDYEKAQKMYFEGVPPKQIAEAVGCKLAVLRNYIARYDWPGQAGIDRAREKEAGDGKA